MINKPLEPLESIPITHGMNAIKVDPNAKYIIFMAADVLDQIGEAFITDPLNPLPVGTPVYIVDNIDNAVRIYQLFDDNRGN